MRSVARGASTLTAGRLQISRSKRRVVARFCRRRYLRNVERESGNGALSAPATVQCERACFSSRRYSALSTSSSTAALNAASASTHRPITRSTEPRAA